MKMQIQQANNGNTLICALCTILIVSLIGANVLVSSANHYNITSKQLKGWKEALYAAESGGDAGFDEVRKLISNSNPWATDGWNTVTPSSPSLATWSKTFPSFGQANSLRTTVTVDKLAGGSVTGDQPFYRIRAAGTARLFGLPRVGMSDQYFAGGPNFVAHSSTRGVGDTLLRKIDFKYDHFYATYGDGDGNFSGPSPTPLATPQVTRRIELVAIPKYFVFGGALRVVNMFNGPGSAGIIDSYSSKNPKDPNPPTIGGQPIPANTSSYWGPNPSNATYLADAHDGDVSVGTPTFTEGGPIWGDVTTNGGNVTHSGYDISGTIDNNVPFAVRALWPAPDTAGYATGTGSGTTSISASGATQESATPYVYSSITGDVTITNANAGSNYPFAYAKIVVNGDITGKITIAKGVTAQIYFTGNMDVKAQDIVNQNIDRGDATPTAYNPGVLGIGATSAEDPNASRAGHLQFYGVAPETGTQTILINSPGNIFATFYAPRADITLKGNPDVFSAIVGRSFSGNSNGGGNTGFHYDKALNEVDIGVVTDYQIASFVEDVR